MWLCSGTYYRVAGISRFARQAGVMTYLLFWTAMGREPSENKRLRGKISEKGLLWYLNYAREPFGNP